MTGTFDVCIIGAGPAGLACLSAIRSPYSLDTLTEGQVILAEQALQQRQTQQQHQYQQGSKNQAQQRRDKQRICVVDSQDWMEGWQKKFDALRIQFLRSPALAHPNLFDQNALLAYAELHGRQNELYESGCFEISKLLPLGQSQIGLWKLPSTQLFVDFCHDMVQSLPHDFVRASATSVHPICSDKNDDNNVDDDNEQSFKVQLSTGDFIVTKAVILAMGTVGAPIVPRGLAKAPRMVQWYAEPNPHYHQLASSSSSSCPPPPLSRPVPQQNSRRVLVVGGGLTAVQTAQKWATDTTTNTVVLCSRKPLVEKHFDVGIEWFDKRTSNKCLSDFYHRSLEERLYLLKSTRGGGSVPPIYMRDLERLQQLGKLKCVVGEPIYDHNHNTNINNGDTDNDEVAMSVSINDTQYRFDLVVLACGVRPDCESNPLLQQLIRQWPVPIKGGFPSVTEDMEWSREYSDANGIFVAGALGSLNLGPDAGNLMGAKRSAQLIANVLSCRSWLRESDVLQNRFSLFWSDSDSESDSDDSDSDDSDLED